MARGAYVARLDADDVAMPRRLQLQLERMRSAPEGCSRRLGRNGARRQRAGRAAAHRWPAAPPTFAGRRSSARRSSTRPCSSSVMCSTGTGSDTTSEFAESEDYELWSRLLDVADGDNLLDPLVLYRVHPDQASQRRRALQRECQLRVALRAIAGVAPELSPGEQELAWRVGVADPIAPGEAEAAAAAYLELVSAFERRVGAGGRARACPRSHARRERSVSGAASARLASHALRLDPALPAHVLARRRGRRRAGAARREAEVWLRRLAPDGDAAPIRVTAVFPEPTPYRSPLLDRVAALSEIDLTVLYAAESVVRRTWRISSAHRAVYLRGIRMPGADRLVRHDYPITPGVVGALSESRPDVVVVSGWSTFAAQAAIAWSRLKSVPYVLVVESHDEGPRSGWRRAVKGTVVPPVVTGASGILVTGTLARDSMIARGAAPERVRVFANTVDVEDFGARADRLGGAAAGPAEGSRRGRGRRHRVVRRSARARETARRSRACCGRRG